MNALPQQSRVTAGIGVKVFYAEFELMTVTRPITRSNHVDG